MWCVNTSKTGADPGQKAHSTMTSVAAVCKHKTRLTFMQGRLHLKSSVWSFSVLDDLQMEFTFLVLTFSLRLTVNRSRLSSSGFKQGGENFPKILQRKHTEKMLL